MSAAADRALAEILGLCARIEPILEGHSPEVQGGVLVKLVGTYIGGFTDHKLRVTMLALHITTVTEYIEDNSPSSGDHTGNAGERRH